MSSNLVEHIKDTVTDLLGYYGFIAEEDYTLPPFTDPVDVAAFVDGDNYPRIVVFCSSGEEEFKLITKIAKHSSVEHLAVIGPANSHSQSRKFPGSVQVFDAPDIDRTGFENFVRSFAPKKPNFPYFSTVARKAAESAAPNSPLEKFERLIVDQGLDVEKAKYEIYRTAISGLNIRYGRYIQVDDDKPAFERSRELSREAILLKAAGYLKEEKLPDRGLGLDSDGNSFLVLSDDEVTANVAEAIVDEHVYNKRQAIRKIMSQYPKMFNYTAIVGSLGYYAPRTLLSIERHRRSWTGVIRATAQSENSSLIEVIRTMINTVGISEEQWNRVNCLASFPEINNLLGDYFEAFEKARIGVFGYRGLKRIYIPAKRIAIYLRISEYGDLIDQDALEEFCIYDAILRSNHTNFNFRAMVKDMGLDPEKVSSRIDGLARMGYCSKLLPEGSDLPIAIYNQNKFTSHCLKVMRDKASLILDVDW